MKYIFLTGLMLLVFTQNASSQSSKEGINYKYLTEVPYYSEELADDLYMKEMCVFDIYYPTNVEDFPTIIWFHGGGLTGGKRSIPEYLKNRGFAIISADYRLSPKVKAITCIEDAAAVTAWAFKNIENYGGNKDLIFVAGMSAGGYLTYMIGLDKTYLNAHQLDANKIAGLIPFSGHAITHFAIRKEMGVPAHQPIVDKFAPLFHVRADAPPLLILTGDRELEMLGRYEENAFMMRMMKVAGHKRVKLHELDGSNHAQMMYPALPLLVREVNLLVQEFRNDN